ncbi:MAG: 50S ribosomal protein L17 [Deltaproteobacteria bacterium]|nr:50S ribosomal protein L17 [Deltaproteobacteria bacterium]
MRHRKSGLKLNRTASHRDAMFRNMVTSLFKHQRIQTTAVKAKELRRWADHLITLAKRGDLHARRQALAIVREKNVVHKLFEEAQSRFNAVAGGYTRVVKLGRRVGDAAPVSIIELVAPAADAGKPQKKAAKAKPAVPEKTTVTEKAAIGEKSAGLATETAPVIEEALGPTEPKEAVEAADDQAALEAAPTEAETGAAGDDKEAPEQSDEAPAPDAEKK